MKIGIWVLSALAAASPTSETPIPTQEEIRRVLRGNISSKDEFIDARLFVTHQFSPDETLRVKLAIRYNDKKQDKLFAQFTAPLLYRRFGILSDRTKDETLVFFPTNRTITKIRGKRRSQAILGTQITYEDLFFQDLEPDQMKPLKWDTTEGVKTVKIQTVPRNSLQYGKIWHWVDLKRGVALKSQYFSRSDRLIKTMDRVRVVPYGPYHRVDEFWVKDHFTNETTHYTVSRRKLSFELAQPLRRKLLLRDLTKDDSFWEGT